MFPRAKRRAEVELTVVSVAIRVISRYTIMALRSAPVAQRIECPTPTRKTVGSNPAGRAKEKSPVNAGNPAFMGHFLCSALYARW